MSTDRLNIEDVAKEMFMALIGIQLIAEQHIEDLAADVQEGRSPDPQWQMELSRWSAIGEAINRYSELMYRRQFPRPALTAAEGQS